MCKNRPWRECCNDCKELEFFCYICKDMVKVKNYIVHLGDHYDDPRLYLTCSICGLIEILLHVDLGMQNVDYMFIFLDIDLAVLVIDSKSMLKFLIIELFYKTQAGMRNFQFIFTIWFYVHFTRSH